MRIIMTGLLITLYLALVMLMCGIGFSAGYEYRAWQMKVFSAQTVSFVGKVPRIQSNQYSLPDTSRAFTYTDERKAAELEERLLRAEAEIKRMKKWRLKIENERRGNAGKSGNSGTH